MNGKLKVLDLFCGGGGSSLGARRAGAEIVMGVDAWDRAIDSYKNNFGGRAEVYSLKPETRPADLGLHQGEISLLLASPECTHHSCAKGSATRSEASKETANYVLNFIRDLRPKWVVIENVIHMRGWVGYAPLLEGLKALEYGVRVEVMDSSEFGVPQTRKRLFLLCQRNNKIPDSVPRPPCKPVSAWEILDYNHKKQTDKWPSKPLKNGRRAEATLERFRRGVEVLGEGVPFLLVYYGSDGSGGWQPLDRPLRTITTLDRFGLITWWDGEPWLRMLQVPELKRAMGIQDADQFELSGSRREQIKQIGNGVAPPVMEAIIRHLTRVQKKPTVKHRKNPRSGVLA